MSPESLFRALSQYVDGELPAAEIAEVEALLETSREAQAYVARVQLLRRHLREEEDGPAPDVAQRVLAAIASEPSRRSDRWMTIAAVFVAGVIGGAAFIGLALRQPAEVAADIPTRVLSAQREVTSLTARIEITERGLHPDVPERTFSGNIVYRAPESIWIEIEDTTTYPSPAWISNDVSIVVDENVAWARGLPGCPTSALPDCTPPEPRLSVLIDREPFPDAAAAPLDLVVPAAGFTRADQPELLGLQRVDDREAVGVAVTAAQVASLLDGLTSTGNWRDIHPTDRVELWLDREALVPLALAVFPAETSDRRLWAIRNGYADVPGTPIFEAAWSDVTINHEVAAEFPVPPPIGAAPSAGFGDGQMPNIVGLVPQRLPDGLEMHRAGLVTTPSGPMVGVVSWSDGRAWLKIRATNDWGGGRLFGDVGTLVRPVALESGLVYVSEKGDRVAVHGEQVDLIVVGTLPTDTLLDVAADLGVVGLPVPADWAEATTATLDEARDAIAGFLVPVDIQGFDPPAIRVDADVSTLAYAGPGNRGFRLAETADTELSPPLEADVRGVTVRGLEARFSPGRGLLEWVEGSLKISLTSSTLSLDELVVIADSLVPP